jgi:uncharacterized membrane protein YdbT with pleckstrin-like domain
MNRRLVKDHRKQKKMGWEGSSRQALQSRALQNGSAATKCKRIEQENISSRESSKEDAEEDEQEQQEQEARRRKSNSRPYHVMMTMTETLFSTSAEGIRAKERA